MSHKELGGREGERERGSCSICEKPIIQDTWSVVRAAKGRRLRNIQEHSIAKKEKRSLRMTNGRKWKH